MTMITESNRTETLVGGLLKRNAENLSFPSYTEMKYRDEKNVESHPH